ncbi:MAG TPA: EI24 domain-containing protein [Fimbriimonadaceae bacterium]|nr:EI24 domain-containing protein [Fimbriimonadaceae bacterium]
MEFILRGTQLVARERRLWPYIWKPLGAAALIYLAAVALCYWMIVPFGEKFLQDRGLPAVFATYGFWFIAIFASSMIYIAVAGIFSSLLWEKLSLEVEELSNPNPPNAKTGCMTSIVDTLGRTGFTIAVGMVGLVLGCFLPLLAVPFVGLLGLHDYTACAFLRRGKPFAKQLGEAFRCRQAFTFTIVSGVLTLFPLLNLLMLPALVAAGTLMVAESKVTALEHPNAD